jgi:hypothetical protein
VRCAQYEREIAVLRGQLVDYKKRLAHHVKMVRPSIRRVPVLSLFWRNIGLSFYGFDWCVRTQVATVRGKLAHAR